MNDEARMTNSRRRGRQQFAASANWSFVIGISLVITHSSLVIAAPWQLAQPGWTYTFPRDHLPHRDFKTEWWYFTGNVRAADGRRFGYQVTFFRQGIRPPSERGGGQSRFIVDDLKFAHFAITDVAGKRFHFQQKLSRGAFGEAGFDQPEPGGAFPRIAWIDDWKLTQHGRMEGGTPATPAASLEIGPPDSAAATFALAAGDRTAGIQLDLTAGKPWAIHGERGVSQKADGEGHASHYYSGPRLATRGTLALDGRAFAVRGDTWFDHEGAPNQLTPAQPGWNWLSLQLDDGAELMLYQMRLRDGEIDPNSSGTFIAADGATRHLRRDDFTLKPLAFWTSKATGARYPIAWQLDVPMLALTAKITTPVENQELVLNPIAYWEGLIDIVGKRDGRGVKGHGYLELTGYAGELVGLSAASR